MGPDSRKPEGTLRAMQPADAPRVATLHAACFPDYLSTALGRRFLTEYYEQVAGDPDTIAWVWEHPGNRLAGFVSGSENDLAMYQRLLRRRGPRLSGHLLIQALRHPGLLRYAGRLRTLSRLLVRILRRPSEPEPRADPKTAGATTRLIVIAVDPELRGAGIAGRLSAAFCREAARRGYRRVGLSVGAGNVAAVKFYRRDGWEVVLERDGQILFERNVFPGSGDVPPA